MDRAGIDGFRATGRQTPPRDKAAAAAAGQDELTAGFAAGYRGRSVLVTGAGGSIGLELCRRLIALGPQRIVILDHAEPALWAAERDLAARLRDGAGPVLVAALGSAGDGRLVRGLIGQHGIDTILHAAAYKHVHLVEANPAASVMNNVFATQALALAARDMGVARMILVSTDKAARPAGVMGATKRLAEIVLQDLAARPGPTGFAIVRFGNVAGSSGSVIPVFRAQIAAGGPVTLTHPLATRYFMSPDEAAELVLAAGSLGAAPDILALDMGAPRSIAAIAAELAAEVGQVLQSPDAPPGAPGIRVVTVGLRPGERLHEEPLAKDAEPVPGTRILRIATPCPSEIEVAALLRGLRTAAEARDEPAVRRAVWRAMAIDRAAGLRAEEAGAAQGRADDTHPGGTGAKEAHRAETGGGGAGAAVAGAAVAGGAAAGPAGAGLGQARRPSSGLRQVWFRAPARAMAAGQGETA